MKILLVEDNRQFVESFLYLMEGLDITAVGTLAAAKCALDTGVYGMVVLDLGLPDSSGLDTLRALRGYAVPKVVLTAALDVDGKWARLGGVDYVVKTGAVETLYERVMFNINRLRRGPRFTDTVFREIRACFERPERVPELTVI